MHKNWFFFPTTVSDALVKHYTKKGGTALGLAYSTQDYSITRCFFRVFYFCESHILKYFVHLMFAFYLIFLFDSFLFLQARFSFYMCKDKFYAKISCSTVTDCDRWMNRMTPRVRSVTSEISVFRQHPLYGRRTYSKIYIS